MSDEQLNKANMPFLSHLAELRRRVAVSLIAAAIGFLIAFIFYNNFMPFMIKPLGVSLYVREITGAFTTRFKVAFLLGLAMSFPVHVYNIVAFITPALKNNERRILRYSLVVSFLLILFGGYMSFEHILPLASRVLLSDKFLPGDTKALITFETAIMFEIKMIFAFLVMFQLPIVQEVLMIVGVISRKQLLSASRYIIVGIFILSAIFTPPDIVSQIGLALPLILLFYLSILIAKICGFGGEKQEPPSSDEE